MNDTEDEQQPHEQYSNFQSFGQLQDKSGLTVKQPSSLKDISALDYKSAIGDEAPLRNSAFYLTHEDFDEEKNFNQEEIENFFGVDYIEMERIVSVSRKYLNDSATGAATENEEEVKEGDNNRPSNLTHKLSVIDEEDERQLQQIKYIHPKVFEMDEMILDHKAISLLDRHKEGNPVF